MSPRSSVDELLGAQPARVRELEQRPVADLERVRGRDPVEQAGDLVAAEHPRQRGAALLRRQQVGRVLVRHAGGDQVGVEPAHRGELAGTVAFAQPALREHRGVRAQVAVGERRRARGPRSVAHAASSSRSRP